MKLIRILIIVIISIFSVKIVTAAEKIDISVISSGTVISANGYKVHSGIGSMPTGVTLGGNYKIYNGPVAVFYNAPSPIIKILDNLDNETNIIYISDKVNILIDDVFSNKDINSKDTVLISVSSNLTNDSEEIILEETSDSSGIFKVKDDIIYLSDTMGFSINDKYLLTGNSDIIKITYTSDITSVSENGNIKARPYSAQIETLNKYDTQIILSYLNDTLYIKVTDLDKNSNPLQKDTITIEMENIITSEKEKIELVEEYDTAGIFYKNIYISDNESDSLNNTGILFALASDTVTALYTDNEFADTAKGIISTEYDLTSSNMVNPVSVDINDSIYIRIDDLDNNKNGRAVDTLTVEVKNLITNEIEHIILNETDKNTGLFSDYIYVTDSISDSIDNSGTLYALAGNRIIINYIDIYDNTDTTASSQITVYIADSISSGTSSLLLDIEDSLYISITDADENYDGLSIDTITVIVKNENTSETEALILNENNVNSGEFQGYQILSILESDTVLNGKLYVKASDIISVIYTDKNDAKDTLIITDINVYIDNRNASSTIPLNINIFDTLEIMIYDLDENKDGATTDTIIAQIENTRTSETEQIVLYETAKNNGIFYNYISTSADETDIIDNDTIFVHALDNLKVTYQDKDNVNDTISEIVLVESNFNDTIYQIRAEIFKIESDTVYISITPKDADDSSFMKLIGNVINLNIKQRDQGIGNFTKTQITFKGDSVIVSYSPVEESELEISLNLLGIDTFTSIVKLSTDTSIPTIISSRTDSTKVLGTIELPDGVFDTSSGYKIIVKPHDDIKKDSADLETKIVKANADININKLSKAILTETVHPEVEYLIVDKSNNKYIKNIPGKKIKIKIKYPDADDDGIVDNTSIDEKELWIYTLDEGNNKWTVVNNSKLNAKLNYVEAEVDHLSVFTLIGYAPALTVNNVRIYPNPFKPNDGDANTGKDYVAGDWTTGIRMDQIPANSKLQIYNLSGSLVREDNIDYTGIYQWDAKNNYGRKVSSGIYIVVVTDETGTRFIDKAAIIR